MADKRTPTKARGSPRVRGPNIDPKQWGSCENDITKTDTSLEASIGCRLRDHVAFTCKQHFVASLWGSIISTEDLSALFREMVQGCRLGPAIFSCIVEVLSSECYGAICQRKNYQSEEGRIAEALRFRLVASNTMIDISESIQQLYKTYTGVV